MDDIVVCKILDPGMRKRIGETIPLKLSKARGMEAKGLIHIPEPGETKPVPMPSVPVAAQGKSEAGVEVFNRNEYRKHSEYPRVAWVQDFSKYGGAEYSNLHVIRTGQKLGFDIVGVTPKTFNRSVIRDAQVVIVNNVFEFDEKQLKDLYWELFEYKKRFIKYDHDMRELRRLPKTRCLFERSAANVFLSNAHAKEYKKEHIYGISIPLAIDTAFWRNLRAERKPNTCIIPTYHKGPQNHDKIIAEHKDWQFTVIGNKLPTQKPNIHVLGKRTPEQMRELYNTHEHMVHCPAVLWAGERVYFEAMLCGCKTIINDNVGHKSWGAIERSSLEIAPYKFWELVENVIEKGKP